jgi:hypothetical protein
MQQLFILLEGGEKLYITFPPESVTFSVLKK